MEHNSTLKNSDKKECETEEKLINEMEELTEEIHKQNSRTRVFWNGVIRGLGYAVGASILFVIAVTVIGYIISYSDADWAVNLVNTLGLEQYLPKN